MIGFPFHDCQGKKRRPRLRKEARAVYCIAKKAGGWYPPLHDVFIVFLGMRIFAFLQNAHPHFFVGEAISLPQYGKADIGRMISALRGATF